MKVKVITAFFDKNTGEPYNAGDVYDSTDKKRISELQTNGYLDASNAKKEATKDTSGEGGQGSTGSDASGSKKGEEGKRRRRRGEQGNKPSDPADTGK